MKGKGERGEREGREGRDEEIFKMGLTMLPRLMWNWW